MTVLCGDAYIDSVSTCTSVFIYPAQVHPRPTSGASGGGRHSPYTPRVDSRDLRKKHRHLRDEEDVLALLLLDD